MSAGNSTVPVTRESVERAIAAAYEGAYVEVRVKPNDDGRLAWVKILPPRARPLAEFESIDVQAKRATEEEALRALLELLRVTL